jgi:hypothetical protein
MLGDREFVQYPEKRWKRQPVRLFIAAFKRLSIVFPLGTRSGAIPAPGYS